jgi:hypothetical protein
MNIYRIAASYASGPLTAYFDHGKVPDPSLGAIDPQLHSILLLLHQLGKHSVVNKTQYDIAAGVAPTDPILKVVWTNMKYIHSLAAYNTVATKDGRKVLANYSAIINFLTAEHLTLSTPFTIAPLPVANPAILTTFKALAALGEEATSTRTLQYPMFLAIFKEFTSEVQAAATAVGNTALQSAVSGNGLLDINKLYNAVKLGKPQPDMMNVAKKIQDDIISNPKRYNITDANAIALNCEIIKTQFMSRFGIIGADKRQELEQNRRKVETDDMTDPTKIDPASTSSTTTLPPELQKPLHPDETHLTNPKFLTCLYAFFSSYYTRLKQMPP